MSKTLYIWTFQTALNGKLTHYLIVSHLIVLLSLFFWIFSTLSSIFIVPYQSCLKCKNKEGAWVSIGGHGFSIFFELRGGMCQNRMCGGSCITIAPWSSWRKLFLLPSVRSFPLEILSPLSDIWQVESSLISYSKACNILKSCNILCQIASSHYSTNILPRIFIPYVVFLPQYDNRGSAADLKQNKIWRDLCIKMEKKKKKKKEKYDVHQFVALQFLY